MTTLPGAPDASDRGSRQPAAAACQHPSPAHPEQEAWPDLPASESECLRMVLAFSFCYSSGSFPSNFHPTQDEKGGGSLKAVEQLCCTP